ncbi:MAG: DUF2703 domain-containing protein [Patescibacteria group bacterium]|jgi:hypothetical protein
MNTKNQCGCQGGNCEPGKENEKTLIISWQRLISDGSTCPRCGSTENELNEAVERLTSALSPLKIKVELRKTELTLEEFKNNPVKSNSISFNGELLEDLVRAKTGQSQCCDVCGDEECRTVEIDGESHEIVPAELIIKAGLAAASKL